MDALHSLSDSFVEGDNPAVHTQVSDGEKVDDIFSITGEFFNPVGESEDGSSDCPVPYDQPIPSVSEDLCWFNCSESDLKVTEFLDFRIVMCRGELTAEDCIKTDCSSGDNILPL